MVGAGGSGVETFQKSGTPSHDFNAASPFRNLKDREGNVDESKSTVYNPPSQFELRCCSYKGIKASAKTMLDLGFTSKLPLVSGLSLGGSSTLF